MEIEREVKFSLADEQADALRGARCIRDAARGAPRRHRVNSTYYDTRKHRLRRAGCALRVRADGDRIEQTLKFATAGPAGMQNCEEWTVALATEKPDMAAFDERVLRRLRHRGRNLTLHPLFTTEIERRSQQLQRGETHFEMAVDRGRIRAHAGTGGVLPVSEVEFELLDGTPLPMFDFLLELIGEVDLKPLVPSKAQRGYTLAWPALGEGASKAEKVGIDKHLTVGTAFQRIAEESLRHLLGNMEATIEGHAEALHQSRVAIRRIRAALAAFRSVLPRQPRRDFNDAFRRVQSALSPARDWHVFRAETLPALDEAGAAGRAAVRRLGAMAQEEERRSTGQAAAALRDQACTELLLRFQRWLLLLEQEQTGPLTGKLKPFARQVLAASMRDLLADPRPLARMKEEERHALRKRGKKARYAMEFFSGLWHGKDVTHHLKSLSRLQDHLGVANDAVVARHLAGGAEAIRASDRCKVEAWSVIREEHCVKAAQPTWRRVQKLEPFWR
jgi:triphosphatase